MRCLSPLAALGRGLAAGFAASYVQSLYFKATGSIAPSSQPGSFEPPEARQADEPAPGTVGRRFVEGMMKRGPLDEAAVGRAAGIVHQAYGAGWGGAYGLLRESVPALSGPLGALAFGTFLEGVAGFAVYPGFRLGPSTLETPPARVAYSLSAHWVYGLALWGAYDAMNPRPWLAAGAWMGLRGPWLKRWVRGRYHARKWAVKAKADGAKWAAQTGAAASRTAVRTGAAASRAAARTGAAATRTGTRVMKSPTGRRVMKAAASLRA